MDALEALRAIVGEGHVLTGADAESALVDWRGRYHGRALALLRPESPDEVARLVRCCAQQRIGLVPQGGNTGLNGGATPDDSGKAIVVSLARMKAIRSVDVANDSIVVEAGCILQDVQRAAQAAGRLFALSLGSEGSCTIGGNLATNAGGTQVLRYGSMRELCLGLEVVTAQGEIWHGLRALRKDNTGYDLRDLFIGSEGTLGIITAATLKLFPLPAARMTALLALDSIEAAVAMLAQARAGFGASLTGFELISGDCLREVTQVFPQLQAPFAPETAALPWHVLIEVSDSESEQHARERFERVLGTATEKRLIHDAAIATSIAHSQALWHLRESIPLAEKSAGISIKHDISLPASVVADFVRDTGAALSAAFPGVRVVVFGHLGDGNLHYNVARGPLMDQASLLAHEAGINALVYERVHALGGSISAEHGIGQLKRELLPRYQDPVALDLMRTLKAALDPLGIMNPGKLLA
ncbi:MAG: FAD-binding oxidoreductase [Dokdonella sp.]|uniref:FAD-binding oxidoreductase n=1 Tax=Dokdonella sp. TaxID=2291710 RepID=UPI0025C4A09B|nr:FAD-binding oxidoreductase [Dokdonella sp.]MBZ0222603.1 FAD-binding oxidoreductase [Dokdonella sp.]MCC7255000.1 FAD-binding oxidoreductase [Dokdonella sp.]